MCPWKARYEVEPQRRTTTSLPMRRRRSVTLSRTTTRSRFLITSWKAAREEAQKLRL